MFFFLFCCICAKFIYVKYGQHCDTIYILAKTLKKKKLQSFIKKTESQRLQYYVMYVL